MTNVCYSKNMKKNLYEQLNNKHSSSPIIIDDQPDFLEEIVIKSNPIIINWKTIDKILLKHGIPKEDLYILKEQIKDNLIIARSLTRNDSILIFIGQWDIKGNPILLSLALNKKANEAIVHKVTSIYGKEKIATMLRRLYNEKKILKCDDMAWQWMEAIGVDVPVDTSYVAENIQYHSKYVIIGFI